MIFLLTRIDGWSDWILGFLSKFIHATGHFVLAWVLGRPAIPIPFVFALPIVDKPLPIICIAVMVGLGYLISLCRDNKKVMIPLCVLLALYPFIAFTRASDMFVSDGGVLFELAGALGCFFLVLARPLQRPFERPLYAAIGWYLLLRRMIWTMMMLGNATYWITGGIFPTATSSEAYHDLDTIQSAFNLPFKLILSVDFLLCLAVAPVAIWLARLWRERSGIG